MEKVGKSGRAKLVAISDNWKRMPFADLLFASDHAWWRCHHQAVRSSVFKGELWTQSPEAAQAMRLKYVACKSADSLSVTPGLVHGGSGNGGFMAMNLAYHFGTKRMILVGYDCQRTNGNAHWFGEHPRGHNLSRTHPYNAWVANFNKSAVEFDRLGVKVINCTTETALECFPRMTLEQAFAEELTA